MHRTWIVVCALVAACSSSSPRASAGKKLASADQVCDALTPDEVDAALHVKTTARMLPKAGEYGAPECGWLASDAAGAAGATVTMFLQDSLDDGKKYFAGKLESVCRGGKRDVAGLGDEAAFCGRLWVRQGSSYFSVSLAHFTGTPDAADAAARQLAADVLPRLP